MTICKDCKYMENSGSVLPHCMVSHEIDYVTGVLQYRDYCHMKNNKGACPDFEAKPQPPIKDSRLFNFLFKVTGGLLLAVSLFAQTPPAGTITSVSSTTTTVTAKAGGITCTFINQVPANILGVLSVCDTGTAQITQTATIQEGAAGWIGSFPVGGNNITWAITKVAGQLFKWEVTANGVSNSGTF